RIAAETMVMRLVQLIELGSAMTSSAIVSPASIPSRPALLRRASSHPDRDRPAAMETPVFGHAAVAAPHSLACQSGLAVLAQGGNAIEAMVAMAAPIAVVYPPMTSIGGDGFWLIADPGRKVRVIEGCGAAAARATPRLYRDAGHDTIPIHGPLAALTVPG